MSATPTISLDAIRTIWDVWPFLLQQFYKNEFLQAAVVGAPVAALSYTARALPKKIWNLIRRTISMDIQFNSDIPDYNFIQEVISKEVVNDKLSRRFLYSAEESFDYDADEWGKTSIGLTSGYGTHWGVFKNEHSWFGRTFVWVERTLSEGGGSQTEKFKETINLTFMTRRKKVIEAFTKMVEAKAGKLQDIPTVQLHVNSGNWWRKGGKLPLRSVSTVFTKDNKGEEIVAAIRKFEQRRDWNIARGLPHRLGVMLYGDPGTGKSSLLHAIASETGRSLYYLNLGGVKNDQELTDLVCGGRNWQRHLLVIEDFDATGAMINRPDGEGETGEMTTGPDGEKRGVTLSALLNILDGVISPDGLVVVATTNHLDRLDAALTRPGRFDVRAHLGPLGWSEFEGMAKLFDHDVSAFPRLKEVYQPTPGSDLRSMLLHGGLAAVEQHFTAPTVEAA